MNIKFDREAMEGSRAAASVVDFLSTEDIAVKFKLKELMKSRGISRPQLSKVTGISKERISNYCSDKAERVPNWNHIACFIIALRVTDLNELLELSMPEETEERFISEKAIWEAKGKLPEYRTSKEQ